MATSRPRASLHTVGCRLNQAETALLRARLQEGGYDLVEFGMPTDLLVLNTCSVTENAEKDCRYVIRRTLRHSPEAFVAVTGCYAQTGAQALGRLPGIDLILGGQYKMSLPELLPTPARLRKRPSPQVLHSKTIDRDDFVHEGVADYRAVRANLKVQDGCNFMCSFCIIPFARGRERSRRMDDLLREAEGLAAKGHRELVLTGVNIGRYDHEGRTILDVIQRLEAIPGIERIRLSSIEPTTIPESLVEYMATSPKLCRYLHVPLQSGDDDILRAMHRRYRAKEYRDFIESALRRVPDLGLGTDVMVGFPGEDERRFANTLALASDLPFSYFHVFSYSPRPGTGALRLGDPVPAKIIAARSKRLTELSRAKRLAFYQRYAGRTLPVLFEETNRDGLEVGLTGNYIRVGVRCQDSLTNSIRDVVVSGSMDGLALGRLAVREPSGLSMLGVS